MKVIILLTLVSLQFICFAQDTIEIRFRFEEKEIILNDNFSLKIKINDVLLKSKINHNKIILDTSNLGDWSQFDIEFKFKKYTLSFEKISKGKLDGTWLFRVDKYPFNKDIIRYSFDSIEYKIKQIVAFSHIPSNMDYRATILIRPVFKKRYNR